MWFLAGGFSTSRGNEKQMSMWWNRWKWTNQKDDEIVLWYIYEKKKKNVNFCWEFKVMQAKKRLLAIRLKWFVVQIYINVLLIESHLDLTRKVVTIIKKLFNVLFFITIILNNATNWPSCYFYILMIFKNENLPTLHTYWRI